MEADEPVCPTPVPVPPKPKEPMDDLTVMNRVKTLMYKLPEVDRTRVANWIFDRWGNRS